MTEAFVTSMERFQDVFRSEADAETYKSQSLTATAGMESVTEILIFANKCKTIHAFSQTKVLDEGKDLLSHSTYLLFLFITDQEERSLLQRCQFLKTLE